MFELLRGLSDWTVGFAESEWSALFLAIASFTESIFFPIPPDPLLIGIAVIRPEAAIWLAAIATLSSVGGALVGYWLGDRLGRPILHRFISPEKVEAAERMFTRYGAWTVLAAAFTPIPYKVFAITAGVLGLDKRTFILASLAGRGARFFILGGLIYAYGDSVEEFIDGNFEILTIGIGAGMVVGLGALFLVVRRRRAKHPVA